MNNKKSSKSARKPRAAKNHDQSLLDQVEAHSSVGTNAAESIENTLSKSKETLSQVPMMTDEDLSEVTAGYYQLVNQFKKVATHAGKSAIICAWTCGKLLNTAKEKLGRGDFGKWRATLLEGHSICERTTQRYMKLAEQTEDVATLLERNSGLTEAYVAAGILPDPESDPEVEVESNTEPETEVSTTRQAPLSKSQALTAFLSSLQKQLRSFDNSGETLTEAEINQILAAKDQIDRFFKKILPDQ